MSVEEVQDIVNQIIREMLAERPDSDAIWTDGPVNWADLSCVEVMQRKDGLFVALVEEADPGAWEFCAEVEKRFLEKSGIIIDVSTEW